MEALHLEQANTDFFILCELLKDYLGLLGSVRDAFHERTKLFQHWQHSQQMLAKKREGKAKMELTNRSDKMDQANAEVVEVRDLPNSNFILLSSTTIVIFNRLQNKINKPIRTHVFSRFYQKQLIKFQCRLRINSLSFCQLFGFKDTILRT